MCRHVRVRKYSGYAFVTHCVCMCLHALYYIHNMHRQMHIQVYADLCTHAACRERYRNKKGDLSHTRKIEGQSEPEALNP